MPACYYYQRFIRQAEKRPLTPAAAGLSVVHQTLSQGVEGAPVGPPSRDPQWSNWFQSDWLQQMSRTLKEHFRHWSHYTTVMIGIDQSEETFNTAELKRRQLTDSHEPIRHLRPQWGRQGGFTQTSYGLINRLTGRPPPTAANDQVLQNVKEREFYRLLCYTTTTSLRNSLMRKVPPSFCVHSDAQSVQCGVINEAADNNSSKCPDFSDKVVNSGLGEQLSNAGLLRLQATGGKK